MFESNTDLLTRLPEKSVGKAGRPSRPTPQGVNEAEADGLRSRTPDAQTRDARIVAIVPRGEVIRNFVYSGAFKYLSQEADLSLLSVSAGAKMDKLLKDTFQNVYPLADADDPWALRMQREIIATAHNRWLWSNAAKERSRLRDAEAKTAREKFRRFLKKAISYPFANRPGLAVLTGLERRLSRSLSVENPYVELFQTTKPTLVFNGSHVHSKIANRAVDAAQRLGIPTATFIFSWDNLTSQGRILHPYDYYLVWNEQLKAQLLELYDNIDESCIFVTGTPQFDCHFRPEYHRDRDEFCEEMGLDPTRPFVLYSTGMANHMPGEPEIVEEIADILASLEIQAKPQLMVRVYPKDRTGRFDDLKKRRRDILFPDVAWDPKWMTPAPSDSAALINSIRHAAVGINVASTVSLELCMFDKPVINIGFNPRSVEPETLSYASYYDFDHYRPVVESGAVSVAWDREQLRDLITHSLSDPVERQHERKAFLQDMFGNTLDGCSANRVADVLLSLASRSKE
jgi:hypothetical protein